jgi:hypothetical protein
VTPEQLLYGAWWDSSHQMAAVPIGNFALWTGMTGTYAYADLTWNNTP